MVTLRLITPDGEKTITGGQYNESMWECANQLGAYKAVNGLGIVYIKVNGEWHSVDCEEG
jgi:hypothetical protein